MALLFVSQGDYQVTTQDILDTLAGVAVADGNIRWKSGTSFYGILDHANTGDRTYTFPNASGQVALLSNPQTWSGLQTFNTGTIKVNDLLFVTGTRSITQSGGEYQLRTESGSVFVLYLNNVAEYTFTSSTLDLGGNILSSVSLIQGFADTNNQIDDTAGGWDIKVSSADAIKLIRGSLEYVNAGVSGNLVLFAESEIHLKVTGSGDLAGFDDGTGLRIQYEFTNDDFSPLDSIASLGKSGRRWVDVWAVNGTIQTSFTKFKKDIQKADCSHCLSLCKKLEPITFVWKEEQFKDMAEEKLQTNLNKKYFGFNADALINEIPEAVAGEDGIYTGAVIGLMLGGIKNLADRIEVLENN